MIGIKFINVNKLRHNDKVKSVGMIGAGIRAKDKNVRVRGQSVLSYEMESFLAYELAPQPPSLFKDGLHEPSTSSRGILLTSFTQYFQLPENGLFVSDGGFLLRRVTNAEVCQSYNISHVQNLYDVQSTVVFDACGCTTSAKQSE